MKKKIFTFLALLLMSVTGVWAEESESFTTTQGETTYTGSHFTINCTDAGDGDGFYLSSGYNATITARNGEIITRVEFTKGYFDISCFRCDVGTTTISGDVATVSGVNATSLTVTATGGGVQIKAVKVYYTTPKVDVTGISLSQTEVSMTVGGEAVTLTATVAPDNATDKTVTWASSDPTVATVANGVVTAVAAGTATITATATNGTDDTTDDKTATCTITVTDPDQAAADAVVALFDALPAADAVTLDDKTAIEAARAAYNALTDDRKALVSAEELAKLTAAEAALAALEAEGIEDVQGEKVQSTKVLRDGHIYLFSPDGAIYNVQGVRVIL